MNISKKQALYRIFMLSLLGLSLQASAAPFEQASLSKLEASSGGRLGISAVDMNTNIRIQYRANERFPMGCTSKVIGVAAILKKSMSDPKMMQEKIFYKKEDLTEWAPITGKHVVDGMTISELSAAAISYSDNTAMNLLVKKLGGIEALNNFARSLHDKDFNQTHGWPAEAKSTPFIKDDSTTPSAMEKSLQKIAFGNVLAPFQKDKLLMWLKNNTTGDKRIRAGVPKGWIVGDKTGSGFHYGTSNDIAIIWPPHCAPIIVTMYYSSNKKEAPKRDDILASATRILINDFARNDSCVAADIAASNAFKREKH